MAKRKKRRKGTLVVLVPKKRRFDDRCPCLCGHRGAAVEYVGDCTCGTPYF
jgi:hypothetical protein